MPIPSFKTYLSEARLPSALASWATAQARTLSDEERTVLLDYADEGYYDINLYLRHAGHLPSMKKASSSYISPQLFKSAKIASTRLTQIHSVAQVMDEIFRKFRLPTAITVYRGTNEKLALYANPKALVGKTLTLPGYTSTSTSQAMSREFDFLRGILLVITVPAGAHAIPMVPALAGDRSDEAEVLLPHNTRLRVDAVKLEPGGDYEDNWIIRTTLIP